MCNLLLLLPGVNAVEVVEGTFNPTNGVLVMHGVAREEPAGYRIIFLTSYLLMVSSDGAVLNGFYTLLDFQRPRAVGGDSELGVVLFDTRRSFGVFRAERGGGRHGGPSGD